MERRWCGRVPRRFLTLAVAWLVVACGGGGGGLAPAAVVSSPAETASDQVSSSAVPEQVSRPVERTSRERELPSSPFALQLPQDTAFIRQPLPPPNSARYANFREGLRIHVGQSHLQQLDVLAGGRTLLVASESEATVRLYDRSSKKLLSNIALPGSRRFQMGGVAAWPEPSDDGALRFVATTPGGMVLVSNGAEQRVLLDEEPGQQLRWSPDRSVLVSRTSKIETQTSSLRFYGREGDELTLLGVMSFSERVDGWDLSRDNRLLAVSHYPSGDLRVIELSTGSDVLRLPGPKHSASVAFSPDGRYVAIAGAGLLVVDLANPARRAHYGYFYNNADTVGFSPSGDAVAVSSYDGRLRVFALEPKPVLVSPPGSTSSPVTVSGLQLSLLKELRHAGEANVYAFVFDADGDGILSASGDRTVRWFRTPSPTLFSAGTVGGEFQSLQRWRESPEAQPWPEAPSPALFNGHYESPLLGEPARAARLAPGRYACKITLMYRLRDCTVSRGASGHTLLTFGSGNLLELQAVVYDDGPLLRFEGWLTKESSLVGCRGCEHQAVHGVLRGSSGRYQGLLTFRNYYDPYVLPETPLQDAKVEEANDRFPLVLKWVKRTVAPLSRTELH